MLTFEDLVAEMNLMGDDGDQWGTAMEWWFGVAGEMYSRGIDIPEDWQYSPGLGGGKDPDSYVTEIFEEASDDALKAFGDFINTRAEGLKEMGLDY